MANVLVFDKYKHLLIPQARRLMQSSYDKDVVEHKITRHTLTTSHAMPFVVKVRDKFDQVDAIHRICKEINHIAEVGALAGCYKGASLFYRIQKTPDSPRDMWQDSNYGYYPDARTVGCMLHVFKKHIYEIQTFYDFEFCVHEGSSLPYYPRDPKPHACECGVTATYGKNATKGMHSDWCPLSVYGT